MPSHTRSPGQDQAPAQPALNLVARLSLQHRLLLVAMVEIAYWIATRVNLQHFKWDTVEAESIRLALRSVSALVDWWLCRELILSRAPVAGAFRSPVLLAGIALFLLCAATTTHPKLQPQFAMLFGFGSIVVALKEEFLFRGIVQNLAHQRLGTAAAVQLTTTVFTFWHYGVVAHTAWSFAQIFLASIILGVIYIRTGSIWAVVVLHAVYDAFFAFPNWFMVQHPNGIAFLELLGAAALLVLL